MRCVWHAPAMVVRGWVAKVVVAGSAGRAVRSREARCCVGAAQATCGAVPEAGAVPEGRLVGAWDAFRGRRHALGAARPPFCPAPTATTPDDPS
jgi:hypothetical protein